LRGPGSAASVAWRRTVPAVAVTTTGPARSPSVSVARTTPFESVVPIPGAMPPFVASSVTA
jgi:hypothetical protein